MLALMLMLVKVPHRCHPHSPRLLDSTGRCSGGREGDGGGALCSGFIAICPGLMKVPCSAPVCLLSSAGREEEERGGREGRDLTSLFFPFSLCAGAGKHMSPLHSGQEDKRARKRKKERGRREEKNRVG